MHRRSREPRLVSIAVFALAGVLVAAAAAAQRGEHPEHPAKEAAEKEHPGKSATGPTFTTRDMGRAIERHVEKDAELKGGKFLVWDAVKERPLVLTLERIHEDRLAQVAEDAAFVCADFKSPDGTVYDLDFFLTGPDGEHLELTELTIHKEAGQARYAWNQAGDRWVRKLP
jgi:hypothetical protein